MKLDPDKWSIVDEFADSKGVPKETRKKWRVRGVPAAWQIRLVQAMPDILSFEDFGTSVVFPTERAAE